MARRKQDLADKFGGDTPAPGWRDMVKPVPDQLTATETAASDDKLKRKTYLLTEGLIDRVAELADKERVGINELVRYLLNFALEEVESGRHELPTETEQRSRIVS